MRLGEHELSFEEGQWTATGSQRAAGSSQEHNRLKKESLALQEENNLLKYKVELLLDMLAASNADCVALQKEIDAIKKAQIPSKKR
eukprot:Em0020g483a